jgi:hypothetical protein
MPRRVRNKARRDEPHIPMTSTSDVIHSALKDLGYTSSRCGVERTTRVAYAVYGKPGERLVLSWQVGGALYEISVKSATTASGLCDEFGKRGLHCHVSAQRVLVYGQEHIDAEVMKMLE